MRITVLTFEGCPSGDITHDLVKRVVSEEGVDAVVERVEVSDGQTARARRFLGSPSVHVNGVDIEPARRTDESYGIACRLYETADGPSGVPPAEMVRDALHTAAPGERGGSLL